MPGNVYGGVHIFLKDPRLRKLFQENIKPWTELCFVRFKFVCANRKVMYKCTQVGLNGLIFGMASDVDVR